MNRSRLPSQWIVLFLFGLSGFTQAVEPNPLAESLTLSSPDYERDLPQLLRSWDGPLPLWFATIMISSAFKVPISFEWTFMEADGTHIDQPKIDFDLQVGDTLASALDRLCSLSDGKLSWGRVRGILCVYPKADSDSTRSNLDAIVSIDVTGVSTWDAFRTLGRSINESSDRVALLTVLPVPIAKSEKPPQAFVDAQTVSLKLDNVPAREAACAIMAASPLELSYVFSNNYRPRLYPDSDPTSQLQIQFHENGRRYRTDEGLLGLEMRQWMMEINEVKSVEPRR